MQQKYQSEYSEHDTGLGWENTFNLFSFEKERQTEKKEMTVEF